jgi:diguanylate cyclase (GGDEF)-like protein/PAS domain S-box-containing protein
MQFAESGRNGSAKSRVLVVDDEPGVLVAIEDLLADEYEVLTADSPLTALRVIEQEKNLAVVISDQRMPGMNGDELLSLLSDLTDATRVMVTGYADLGSVIRAVNRGHIFAYVTKPWDGIELRMTVQKCVEHFDLLRKLARERQLLEDLMNNIPDAIYFKDRDLRFERANHAVASHVGLPDVAETIGKRLSELGVAEELAASVERDETAILAQGRVVANLLRAHDSERGRRFYSTTVAPVRGPDGVIQGLVGISRDVTEKEETEQALRRLTHVRKMLSTVNAAIVRVKERNALVREACRIAVEDGGLLAGAILLFDRERGLVRSAVSHGGDDLAEAFVNAWTRIGAEDACDRTTLVRTRRPTIINRLQPDDTSRWTTELAGRGARSIGLFPLISDERMVGVFALISGQPQFFDGEEERLLAELADNIAAALDHIEKRTLLDFLAYYDELTNLPKRGLLLDRLHQLLPARVARGERIALVLIDVSRFRHVNDTLGRLGGDELLVQLSKRFSSLLAEGDTLARFDSNAFAFLLAAPGDESELGVWIDKAVFGAFSAPMMVRNTELRVACRMGVALFPADATEADDLVRNAEAALANARVGGQRCLFYAPSMNARMGEKLTLETRLRRAVEEHQFLLHYQPKVDLKTGGVVGLEALIRWQDPERGLISPAQFIPILEETGLILEVGDWVLDCAAAQYAAWLDQGLTPPRIAANVSAIQLSQPTFVQAVERVLERHPAAQGGLDLELTESVLMDDLSGNIGKLCALQNRGVRIAIDDFGTGYSSLGYLSRLPIDTLKIDRSFVNHVADDPQDMTIVTTIISLAHSLDLKVIAEGVETADQARLLRLVGCDEIQGYLVGRPQRADEVTAQFRARKTTWPPPAQ